MHNEFLDFTELKVQDFSVTHILREINSRDSRRSKIVHMYQKSVKLTVFGPLTSKSRFHIKSE